jgi:O-antigen/teichoic acid export membrane protein
MGVVLIFGFCTILLGQLAIATGRQRFWNTLMAAAIAVSIPLDLVFVPWMERAKGNGAIGGGLSYLVTEGFMLVIGAGHLAPHVVRRRELVRILKIVVAGGLMVMATWPWRDRFLLVPVVVGALVYSAVVVALGVITKDERDRVVAMVRRRRSGAET